MTEKLNKLPPIIQQYIEQLSGKGGTSFQKETACMVLEHVIAESQKAVVAYKAKFKRY